MIKVIPDTKGKYSVSNDGYVYGPTGTELTQQLHSGYCIVQIRRGVMLVSCRVHRLVAEMFCEKKPGQSQVHHIDGNPYNNKASNLVWCNDVEHGKLDRGHTYTAIKATDVLTGEECLYPSFSSMRYHGIQANKVKNRIESGKAYLNCKWEYYYGPVDA